jgi:nitrogen fixation protein FixH
MKMKLKISWGTGIVIVIGVFLGISISTGIYMMSQDVNLVADDYYDKEIKYQEQIDRIERTNKLNEENIVTYDGATVIIKIPQELKSKNVEGEIHFYRPSDASADLKIPLSFDSSGVQVIPVSALAKGLWTVKVDWLVHGEEYFNEKRLFLK